MIFLAVQNDFSWIFYTEKSPAESINQSIGIF
jgi:hypothetical protein